MKPVLHITPEELARSVTNADWIKVFKAQFHVPAGTKDEVILEHVNALLSNQYATWSDYVPAMTDSDFSPMYEAASKKLPEMVKSMRSQLIDNKVKAKAGIGSTGRRNFLQYTAAAILGNGYTYSDVQVVGSMNSPHRCTWLEFLPLADFMVELGDDWGMRVASDLTLLMKDGGRFILVRRDADLEWVCIKPLPVVGDAALPITKIANRVIHVKDFTLAQLNEGDLNDAAS